MRMPFSPSRQLCAGGFDCLIEPDLSEKQGKNETKAHEGKLNQFGSDPSRITVQ
jgi:hypothetical protein